MGVSLAGVGGNENERLGDAVLLTLRSVSLLPAKDVKEWMGVKCSGKAAKWKVLNK